MPTEILMPQLGESVVEGTVSAWLKHVGDAVARFEPLLIVETDKVTTEIPSPGAGVVLQVFVHEGETVAKGTCLALIAGADEISVPQQPAAGVVAPAETPTGTATATQFDQPPTWHITPVVARMAAEHHLDLSTLTGRGRGGRVTKKDVETYLSQQSAGTHRDSSAVASVSAVVKHADTEHAAWETPGSGDLFKPTEEYSDAVPPASPSQHTHSALPASGDTLMPLTPMRRTIAERMIFSRQHYAHVTTVWEIDLTAVQAHRIGQREAFARQGVRLTLTPYFLAAVSQALHAVPVLNGEWRDEGILLHHQHHIGIAVALDEGLIVPVLRSVEDMSLSGIARGVHDLAERARTHRLKSEEVKGGTFTLSNHGVSGSLFATPIITPPQVGILGVGVMEQRVKVVHGMIAIRPCVYASLTFDHRAADGATGDAFMAVLKQTLETWSP